MRDGADQPNDRPDGLRDADPSHPAPSLDGLRSTLERVRAMARAALVTQRTAWVLSIFIAAALGGGVLDYVLRTPAPIRAMVWLGVAGLLSLAAVRWIWPAIRFRPSLTEVALRVERSIPGGSSSGELASGLELAEALQRDPTMRGRSDAAILARGAVAAASSRAQSFGLWQAFKWAGTVKSALTFGLAAAVTIGVFAASPRLFTIGAKRVLAPWAHAPWPKRTGVVDATAITAHPIGSALPLRAAIYRTNKGVGRTDVRVAYRVIDGMEAGPVTRSLLTGQGKAVPIIPTQSDGHDTGELYERLVEAGAIVTRPGAGRQLTLQYWFETDDDQSERGAIILVDPPAVLAARASVEPPQYAAALASRFTTGQHDLGSGQDEKGVIGPVLAGSRVRLELELNKPLTGQSAMLGFGRGLAEPEGMALALSGSAWTIEFVADKSLRLPVALVDEFGISAAQDAVFTIDVAADAPPTAAVLEPSHDESVLVTAELDAAGEGRDDVGLSWIELRTQKAAAPSGSAGAPAVAVGEPEVAARMQAPAASATALDPGAPDPSRQSIARTSISLKALGLKPGDELWMNAVAKDIFALDGKVHEPVVSQTRRLRVISESEFVEQLQAEMNGLRQTAQRLDDDQKKLQAQQGDKAFSTESQRAQQQITERLAPTREAVERLIQRVERNGLQDPALRGILQDAGSLAGSAAERSSEAQAAMEKAAQSPSPEKAQAVGEAQQEAREELARLIDTLERGKDNWAARRDVEKLLQAQKDIREQTDRTMNQLAGKQNKDLTPPELAALEALAQRQRALAEQTAASLDNLGERAQRLKQTDPVQAEAIQQAAQQGRQDRVADQQQQAAEQIQENRTQQAGDQQDQAIKSLEKMLSELDQGSKKRAQTLRRLLADLTKQLEELAQRQQSEITALVEARKSGAFEGLDATMLKINQDTLGISQRARTTFKELSRIVEPLTLASRAQGNAIAGLRAQPVDPTKADTGERLSLDKINEALELARKSEEDTEQQERAQKVRELRESYREALERQSLLEQQTAPYIGKYVGRRERPAILDLAERQRSLRDQLEDLRTKTSGLKEAGVFDFAHTRLDLLTSGAARQLDDLSPSPAVARSQASARRVLKSLVDALSDANKEKDFREGQGEEEEGGGGGGGGAGEKKDPLIQPIAELKLLREMQAELAEMTKAVADAAEPAGELEHLGALQTELTRQAKDLLERTKEQNQGPGPGVKKEGKPDPGIAPGGPS